MRWRLILAGLILFGGGMIAGYLLGNQSQVGATGTQLRKKDPAYEFISPLIACISSDKSYFSEFKTLNEKLASYAAVQKRAGNVDEIGVYFRDLANGHWAGINETMGFFPASLFKVPIMMAYFKQAEQNPNILKQKFPYHRGVATVEELIDTMIIASDDDAKDVLLEHVNVDMLNGILNDLEITVPDATKDDEAYTISPRKYSLLFRVLYNATLLNNEMSEKTLELLGKTQFHDGITAPLPNTVAVAHKFGVHASEPIGPELHDCGIVYRQNNSYFLCIMTKGHNPARLAPIIQEISKMIWDEAGKVAAK